MSLVGLPTTCVNPIKGNDSKKLPRTYDASTALGLYALAISAVSFFFCPGSVKGVSSAGSEDSPAAAAAAAFFAFCSAFLDG